MWVGRKDRGTNRGKGAYGTSAEFRLEDLSRSLPIRDLLKRFEAILLKRTVDRGQKVAVKENTEPSPQRPLR